MYSRSRFAAALGGLCVLTAQAPAPAPTMLPEIGRTRARGLCTTVRDNVAPAVLGYTLGLRGLWDVVVLTFFVCCGISRLARFNVTAADTLSELPTEELLRRYAPDVELRHPIAGTSSAVSCEKARDCLGYVPQHTWR